MPSLDSLDSLNWPTKPYEGAGYPPDSPTWQMLTGGPAPLRERRTGHGSWGVPSL